MKQKFQITLNNESNKLQITEFMEWEGRYVEMCVEEYDNQKVQTASNKGIPQIISAIRTTNLYPCATIATSIAEAISDLYLNTEGGFERSVEYEDIEEYQVQEELDDDIVDDELSDLTDDLADEEIDDGYLDDEEDIEKYVPKTTTPVDNDLNEDDDI